MLPFKFFIMFFSGLEKIDGVNNYFTSRSMNFSRTQFLMNFSCPIWDLFKLFILHDDNRSHKFQIKIGEKFILTYMLFNQFQHAGSHSFSCVFV